MSQTSVAATEPAIPSSSCSMIAIAIVLRGRTGCGWHFAKRALGNEIERCSIVEQKKGGA